MTKVPDNKKIEIARWLLDPDGVQLLPEDLAALEARLKDAGLWRVYAEIDVPLAPILDAMSKRGILVDTAILANLQKDLQKEINDAVKKIYAAAGKEINLNSPKQLGELLYDTLKIKPRGGKTSGGARSTSAESLEAIAGEHEVVPLVLKYRELFKLQSTYAMPLLELAAGAKDHRIHTTFLQTSTATGRLSSENPNMQNIPTGTDIAKTLRSAFVAAKGCSLLSLDYSQIELRVMASVSEDPKMIDAFNHGEDIHKITASNVFDIPVDQVTKEQRQMAKTLNFGVIYGMGPQAFSRQSGLSFEESQRFIAEYFHNFANIEAWQRQTIQKAEQLGYVENLNGRKRWLPNIISPSPRSASEARRAGINMPIQSLAADIMKIAMIRVSHELPDAAMLLSIHDELVFEVPDAMLKEVAEQVRRIMESAYTLKVPLRVDVASGKNWGAIS